MLVHAGRLLEADVEPGDVHPGCRTVVDRPTGPRAVPNNNPLSAVGGGVRQAAHQIVAKDGTDTWTNDRPSVTAVCVTAPDIPIASRTSC